MSSVSVSICMPVYNGIEFIHESVTSVIHQTYPHWELIVGINGHPPNSDVYLNAKTYEALDSRIKVIDLFPLRGKAQALNAMLAHCSHSYVALLDVDDWWEPNKLQVQTAFLPEYDVVGSKCVYFGDIVGCVPAIPEGDITHHDFSKVNPIINSSSVIRKSLCFWNHVHNGVEDYDLWLRLRKQGNTFYNCPEILVKHRIHATSAFNAKGNHNQVPTLLKEYGY